VETGARELFAPLGPSYDRYARLLSFGQDPRCFGATDLGLWVWAEDDRIARHQSQQRLEIDRGDRIGHRDQREDDTGRPWQGQIGTWVVTTPRKSPCGP
jgi:hypothetical protein